MPIRPDGTLYAILVEDGVFGSYTKRALQAFLKYKAGTYDRAEDGIWAYNSQYAFQRWLVNEGYYQNGILDGDAGPLTWSAWINYHDDTYGTSLGWYYSGHVPESSANLCRSVQNWLNMDDQRRIYG